MTQWSLGRDVLTPTPSLAAFIESYLDLFSKWSRNNERNVIKAVSRLNIISRQSVHLELFVPIVISTCSLKTIRLMRERRLNGI